MIAGNFSINILVSNKDFPRSSVSKEFTCNEGVCLHQAGDVEFQYSVARRSQEGEGNPL